MTTTNGLPHNSVTGVEQDKTGFLWISTADGLARYDGRTFKVFRHRPGDSTSLVDNEIVMFEKTRTGSFLITASNGSFQLFDPRTERFTEVLNEKSLARQGIRITKGKLSADGRYFWGLMPGLRLIRFDLQRKTTQFVDVAKLTGLANVPSDFILTPDGYLYAECDSRLFQLNTKTGESRLICYPFNSPPVHYWPIDYHQIALAPRGEIAVFGYQVIALYNPALGRFRTIPIPDWFLQRDTWYQLKTLADNRLYVGYDNRLYRLDANDQLVRIPLPAPTSQQTSPWLLDRSGVLWVGGRSTGLARIDVRPQPFGFAPRQKAFGKDLLEQDLGVSLPGNYTVWDIDHWPRYTFGPNRAGYLIDTQHVYEHKPGRDTLTELRALHMNAGEPCCKLCLKVSRRGQVWFYSNSWGLIEGDPKSGTKQLYPNSRLPLISSTPGHDAADIQPIGHSIWVGSQYGFGLFRYDITRKRFDKPLLNNPKSTNSLPINAINCLSADPTDSTVLWIGTPGGGLCRLNTRTMVFRRMGEPEGFPNGTILSIETDGQGMIWCSTNRGLVRVNPKTLTWRHFTVDDGLHEDSFLQTSSARLPDGRLVFGTPKGRIIFDPLAVRDQIYQPPIVLSSLLINNKVVDSNSPEGRNTLPTPINSLSELILDHTQNFLTIGFAGLHYGKAERLNYRYRLSGVDDGWVTVGTQNTANYTQLSPGRYVFNVNSTTPDGQWSRQIKQLMIVIKPPFWATWWAYAIYVLVFGSLVFGFIRFRLRQARQQQEITLKRRESEQLRAVDEVKTRFFSNITHEFRTPLTLILSPTEKLLKTAHQDNSTRQSLTLIHQNARQLLRLINQLLDLSKLEGSSMSIALVRGNPVVLIEHLVDTFLPMAASRGTVLRLETNGLTDRFSEKPGLFDANKWETILTNLLSNALKFTPTGGQVLLTLDQPTADQLEMRVSDTGVGIPVQHIPHIFDRFYQVDTSRTRSFEGTGIGLALVKELTDLLGGTIAVQSRTENPSGTTFTLTLPVRPATDQLDTPELLLPGSDLNALRNIPTTDRAPLPRVSDDAPLVLVVDDNEELRTFIARELMDRYRVLMAADGEEGWSVCQRELPDVVITDVMMPRLDGYQLTNRIKSTLATNHIAVVLLTARAAQESRIAGLEQGADDYLTKPFHSDELSLRLDNMLTRQAHLRAYLHRQVTTPAISEGPMVDPFVRQLHQAIEERLDDATFGIDELAQAVSMSRRTLNRKLTATANLSASDFIRHYRLQRATQLLKTGSSIAETAYGVGFESPAYFATVFKQTYHQTPSEYLSHQRA
ncbi:hybrid sensor histidine kinase/response regulator transcription factor [Larkinella terrae]|uniref:hybrid sensor histidine kinase/response regulator transcription factor n=1 Tax=Larkinella terrae TaxID=2025311 RepID=UPI00147846BB|nr:hybrid sensor histidine kinase/response regulator transcription factor [Larkinella terrae]